MQEVLIFANPIAGHGKGKAVASALRDRLEREGFCVQLFLDRAASVRWQPRPDRPAQAAIVIGGDGTLRSVAQWAVQTQERQFAEQEAATGPQRMQIPPLLVVPLGTANLMGRHLGIAWEENQLEDQVVAALQRHKVAYLDAAQTPQGIFLLMAGVGIDGHVVRELDRMRRGPISVMNYVGPVLRTLADYRFPPLQVTVDGRRVFDLAPALAFIGNIAEYGTGFAILPQAQPDDGLLDVCVLPCSSLAQLMDWFVLAAAGQHLNADGAVYLKGRHVLVESPQPVPVQVDGEAAGCTPFQADLLPGRIPFIVP